jgi:lysophospholipase L1-like esterase
VTTTIFWAGDSTASLKRISAYPETGIGQLFDYYLREGVFIENHAMNGRSTKSFLDEGRLVPIAERLRPGDYLFIQFGHNDQKIDMPERYAAADSDFRANLKIFIDVARTARATPVLISPVARRELDELGNLLPQAHAAYGEAARLVAEETGVAFVDLTASSIELLVNVGLENAKRWFMHLAPGEFPSHPEGLADNTHLRPEGALAFGALLAQGLLELGYPYAGLVNEFAASVDPAKF